MTEEDRAILESFADRVRSRFPEARIWAFGSRARGDATWDSDFDVCVVVERLDDDADRWIMDAAFEVGFDADAIISTVTFSRADFTTGPVSCSSLAKAIRREGVAA